MVISFLAETLQNPKAMIPETNARVMRLFELPKLIADVGPSRTRICEKKRKYEDSITINRKLITFFCILFYPCKPFELNFYYTQPKDYAFWLVIM
jgi:hypothetical protein